MKGRYRAARGICTRQVWVSCSRTSKQHTKTETRYLLQAQCAISCCCDCCRLRLLMRCFHRMPYMILSSTCLARDCAAWLELRQQSLVWFCLDLSCSVTSTVIRKQASSMAGAHRWCNISMAHNISTAEMVMNGGP